MQIFGLQFKRLLPGADSMQHFNIAPQKQLVALAGKCAGLGAGNQRGAISAKQRKARHFEHGAVVVGVVQHFARTQDEVRRTLRIEPGCRKVLHDGIGIMRCAVIWFGGFG